MSESKTFEIFSLLNQALAFLWLNEYVLKTPLVVHHANIYKMSISNEGAFKQQVQSYCK